MRGLRTRSRGGRCLPCDSIYMAFNSFYPVSSSTRCPYTRDAANDFRIRAGPYDVLRSVHVAFAVNVVVIPSRSSSQISILTDRCAPSLATNRPCGVPRMCAAKLAARFAPRAPLSVATLRRAAFAVSGSASALAEVVLDVSHALCSAPCAGEAELMLRRRRPSPLQFPLARPDQLLHPPPLALPLPPLRGLSRDCAGLVSMVRRCCVLFRRDGILLGR